MDKVLDVEEKSHGSDVLVRFDRFRKNRQYCDFKIRCGSQEFPVHKSLIAASSDYFDAMLSHDTIENQNGFVELKEVGPEGVAKCVDFMYTGKAVVSERKQVEVIHVASVLQLHKFCYQIGNAMKADMDVKSFFTIRKIAVMYGLEALSEACALFAANYFCVIMKMEEFRDLEAKYLESLLFSPYLNLIADVKCKALMNWAYNDSTRVASLFDLIKLMDVSKVRVSYRKFLLDVPIIFSSPQCLEYIKSTIPDENDVQAADYSGDCSLKILSFNRIGKNIECFDLNDNPRSQFSSVDVDYEDYFICLVAIDNYLYLISHKSFLFRLNFVEKNATWEKLSSANGRYSDSNQTAILNGSLYLWGCTDFERYNFMGDHWSDIPRWRLFNNSGACMTAANGKLIIVSGDQDPDNVYSVSEAAYYDPNTSSWSSLSSLHRARGNASACTHMNVVYIFGGENEVSGEYLESVEILYSLDTPWVLVDLPGLTCSNVLSYSFNGIIYLVGGDGYDPSGSSIDGKTAVVFDPKTKSYRSEIALIPGRLYEWGGYIHVMVVL